MSSVTTIAVEELAQRFAAEAGVAWASLNNYPGYLKNTWREKALEVLAAAGLHAEREAEPAIAAAGPRFLN